MREIDTDALQLVARSLGVGNPATLVEPVSFDDSTLQQSYDVVPLVRRARSVLPSSGIWGLRLRHSAATETTQFDPYALVSPTAPTPGEFWPDPVPDDLDVWLIGPWTLFLSEPAMFGSAPEGAYFTIRHSNPAFASGPALQILAAWTNQVEINAFSHLGTLAGGAITQNPVAHRLRRGSSVEFQSTRDPLVTGFLTLYGEIGLFPAALGQDAIS